MSYEKHYFVLQVLTRVISVEEFNDIIKEEFSTSLRDIKYIDDIAYIRFDRRAKTLENAVNNTFRTLCKHKKKFVVSCTVFADVQRNGGLEPAVIVGRY